jgi:hypothetical protein
MVLVDTSNINITSKGGLIGLNTYKINTEFNGNYYALLTIKLEMFLNKNLTSNTMVNATLTINPDSMFPFSNNAFGEWKNLNIDEPVKNTKERANCPGEYGLKGSTKFTGYRIGFGDYANDCLLFNLQQDGSYIEKRDPGPYDLFLYFLFTDDTLSKETQVLDVEVNIKDSYNDLGKFFIKNIVLDRGASQDTNCGDKYGYGLIQNSSGINTCQRCPVNMENKETKGPPVWNFKSTLIKTEGNPVSRNSDFDICTESTNKEINKFCKPKEFQGISETQQGTFCYPCDSDNPHCILDNEQNCAECVECVDDSHCGTNNPFCVNNMCLCKNSNKNDNDTKICAEKTNICNQEGNCVNCLTNEECNGEDICKNGTCIVKSYSTIGNDKYENKYPLSNKAMQGNLYTSFENHDTSTDPYHDKKGHCHGAGCPEGWKKYSQESCGTFNMYNRSLCEWKSDNFLNNKENCCAGDSSILTKDGRIDKKKCKIGYLRSDEYWMPWSPSCDKEQPVKDFCGGKDELGNSRIISNDNCRNWCSLNPEECFEMKDKFCKDNKTNTECKCYYIEEDPYYIAINEQVLNSTANPDAWGASLGKPVCWVPGCISEQDGVQVLLSKQLTEDKKNCTQKDINICQQIINVSDSDHIQIEDLTWTQNCGGYTNPTKKCNLNSDCKNGNNCIESLCKCGTDICDGNENCINNQCILSCDDETSCFNNNKCVDGLCKCGNSKGCVSPFKCKDGLCTECDNENPCKNDNKCVEGKCVCGETKCSGIFNCKDDLCKSLTFCSPSCKNNNQCDLTNNKCYCGDGDECTGEKNCKDGVCVKKTFFNKYKNQIIFFFILILIAFGIIWYKYKIKKV